ncbi:MAG TPA: PEGA domain-containing protein, partial [Myxococcaceae bacterium]|nr:PEGA domain-containing protein [Myxococcaceae bacterium]
EPTDLTVRMETRVKKGRLLVIALPEQAEIRVKRQVVKPAGVPEPYLSEVTPGEKQTVEVRYEGFKPVTREVTVPEADALHPVYIRLEPQDLTVDVTSQPSGASVVVDGREMGITPMQVALGPATGQVQLRKRCFQTVKLSVDGKPAVHAVLKKVAGCKP